MKKPNGYWHNYEHCKEAALQCSNRSEFQKKFMGAYTVSRINGWLEEFFGELVVKPPNYWTKERCAAKAKLCKTRLDFRNNYKSAHDVSQKHNWLEEFFGKLDQKPYRYWNKERCAAKAKLCKSKEDFRKRFKGAYKSAWKNNWLDEFFPFNHCGGFNPNKPATLYYIRINKSYGIYYKIGITNRSVLERFTKDELRTIAILKEWEYPLGSIAKKNEQEILKLYSDKLYDGIEPILKSGTTEIFTKDVLELDYDKR